VERAIQSVLAQTFTEWHLIVIDDASTDGTLERVKANYGSDSRVSIMANAVNTGPAETRNLGFGHATGEWIALIDSDDAWTHDRLANLYSACAEYDFIADGLMTYDAVAMAQSQPLFEDFDSPQLALDDFLSGRVGRRRVDGGYLKPMMRASFLRKAGLVYDGALRHGEDFVFYCEALCLRARFGLVNGNGYIYTTPLGRLSKRSSPYSHTTPDPVAMSAAMCRLSEKYASSLNASESAALERYGKDLAASRWTWQYEAARERREYLDCACLLSCHTSVWRHLLRSLLSSLGIARHETLKGE